MPLRPKKCCGKKVRLTPKNIPKNWTFNHLEFNGILNSTGNQCTSPLIIAKTAPIDKT